VLSFVRRRIQLSYSKQVRQKRPHNDPALIPQLDDRVVALVLTKSHAALLAQTSGGLAWDRRLLGSTVRNETTLLARNVHGLLDRRPLEPELFRAVQRYPERQFATRYQKPLVVVVDREKVGFSSWYDLFPRSCCSEAGRHGTFRDCEEWLPNVASMGFDVVYLPPVHPIGHAFRKGKNNTVQGPPVNPRFPPTIRVSLTTSQVLRRPPEVT